MRTLAVLAVLVAVLALVLVLDLGAGDRERRRERAEAVFADWSPEVEPKRIRWTTAAGRIELAAEDGRWRLAAPLADRADGGRVATLLSALRSLRAERRMPVAELELGELGLDEPAATLGLAFADGLELELMVGSELPLDGLRALRRGDEVVFAREFFSADLERPVEHWRDRAVLDPGFGDPRRWRLEDESGVLELERRESRWWLVGPLTDLASPRAAEDLVSVLAGASVAAFGAEAAEPVARLRLESTSASLELGLGPAAPERLIEVPDRGWLLVRLPRALEVPVEALRCPFLWCFQSWEGAAWSVGGRRLERADKPGEWRLVGDGEDRPVAAAPVTELFSRLAALTVRPVDGPWTVPAAATASLELDGGERVGLRRVEAGVLAVDGRPGFYEVDAEALDELLDLDRLVTPEAS